MSHMMLRSTAKVARVGPDQPLVTHGARGCSARQWHAPQQGEGPCAQRRRALGRPLREDSNSTHQAFTGYGFHYLFYAVYLVDCGRLW